MFRKCVLSFSYIFHIRTHCVRNVVKDKLLPNSLFVSYFFSPLKGRYKSTEISHIKVVSLSHIVFWHLRNYLMAFRHVNFFTFCGLTTHLNKENNYIVDVTNFFVTAANLVFKIILSYI